MPPRRDVDDPAAELERIREQTRARVKRYREKRNATGNVTPPHTPPVSPPLSLTEIERALAPLTKRGYVHAPRFWHLAAAEYPLLNLELEALKLADWLLEPRNAKRRCSKSFLDNWLKGAEQRRKEREAQPRPRTAQSGPVDPPIAFQTNPGPDPAPWLTGGLQTFTPEELKRLAAEHARVPFKDRLAAKAALATNGVHK